MPLPTADQQWPPLGIQPMYQKMAEWAAWYSGEPMRIMDVYSVSTDSQGPVPWWRFWTRARAGYDGESQRSALHVPIASDLAATSGALLFGDLPQIRVREARDAESDGPEQATEKRLLQIMEEGDFYSRLVEAAETAAAIGGVYVYPVWDENIRPFPLMGVAQADMAVPEFRWGLLTAVTFFRTVRKDNGKFFRHLERHEVEGTGAARKAVILNGLFEGTADRLGPEVALTADDVTAAIPSRIELPFAELDVEYVPNRRPNRLWRASGHGVADIQGSESLLDALDETYASWMRDIRLAKARIIVPREYLRHDKRGQNPGFDIDQEVYVGMDMEPGLTSDARSMLAHQFEIRYLEHGATARDLVERIVSNAGYAGSTLGTSAGEAAQQTGTALRIKEHKTLLTLRRKAPAWRTAIANTLWRMQLIDKEVFRSAATPIRPTVKISDSVIDQPLELAQTALALKTAESASTETRVRLVHPDWSESEVDAEVKRIEGERDAAAALESRAKFGDEDPASTGNAPITKRPSGPAPTNAPPPQATKRA